MGAVEEGMMWATGDGGGESGKGSSEAVDPRMSSKVALR